MFIHTPYQGSKTEADGVKEASKTPGAQPSHQGQCSDLPGPSASALAFGVTTETEGQGARPRGEREPAWEEEEGMEE